MLKTESPRLLFVSLVNDVASDRIVASMRKLGAHCAVMSAPDAFAARTAHAEHVFALPRLGGAWTRSLILRRRLAAARRVFAPDMVIPLDEMAAVALRDARLFARSDAALKALLEASFGRPDSFALSCDRHRLIEKAAALGLATPEQVAVADLDAARAVAARLGYPVVLKREQTCGGAGVQIVANEAELITAYRRAATKAARKRRLRAILGRAVASDSALVLQRFVTGPLAFRIVACKDGRVLDGVSFLSDCVHPPVTGASTILQPIERHDMDAAASALVGALGCSGFVALDFLLPADNQAVLIEMNPRPVASGHLGRLVGHDVHAALLDALRGRETARGGAPIRAPTRIALFPRELDRNPTASLRADPDLLHDVPWDDHAAIAAHAAWLARRHPAFAAYLARMLGITAPEPQGGRPGFADLFQAATRLLHAGRISPAK